MPFSLSRKSLTKSNLELFSEFMIPQLMYFVKKIAPKRTSVCADALSGF